MHHLWFRQAAPVLILVAVSVCAPTSQAFDETPSFQETFQALLDAGTQAIILGTVTKIETKIDSADAPPIASTWVTFGSPVYKYGSGPAQNFTIILQGGTHPDGAEEISSTPPPSFKVGQKVLLFYTGYPDCPIANCYFTEGPLRGIFHLNSERVAGTLLASRAIAERPYTEDGLIAARLVDETPLWAALFNTTTFKPILPVSLKSADEVSEAGDTVEPEDRLLTTATFVSGAAFLNILAPLIVQKKRQDLLELAAGAVPRSMTPVTSADKGKIFRFYVP